MFSQFLILYNFDHLACIQTYIYIQRVKIINLFHSYIPCLNMISSSGGTRIWEQQLGSGRGVPTGWGMELPPDEGFVPGAALFLWCLHVP